MVKYEYIVLYVDFIGLKDTLKHYGNRGYKLVSNNFIPSLKLSNQLVFEREINKE